MSIPPESPCRGCASSFNQPVTEQDRQEAQNMIRTVHNINCVTRNPPLANIVYRAGVQESDATRHLFRWDIRPYTDVFENGFRAVPVPGTPIATSYDLPDYVNNAGAPLSTARPRTHVFLSTTLNTAWRPVPDAQTLPGGREIQAYRYEIYAPGGIWVAATLTHQYQYPAQDEVCFVTGIARQYIRSAQLFIITRPAYDPARQPLPNPRYRRAGTNLMINRHFNPLSDPTIDLLLIQMPVFYYYDEDHVRRILSHETYPPTENERRKRYISNSDSDAALKWYGNDVANATSYIDAAFLSSYTNEAYIFMKNEYVLLNYAPHTTGDRILNGPLLICDGFPSLIGTSFGEYGIDCAFDTEQNKAFIFSTNLCAYIDYAPRTTDDKILSGPMTISDMFPSLKNTIFESGIDSAFRSTVSKEAYLFKGDKYALINYGSKNVIHIQKISDGFPCLLGTIFATGIDAAFASHKYNEAYIFKGELYALINFAPHTTDDYMIDGRVKPILPNWPSLRSILPRKNGGTDDHDHHK